MCKPRCASRARSAPSSPAAPTPATCAAMGGERQPGRHVCQLEVLGAAHRGSRRVAPVATRHARGRPARRPPPSAGAPAADHAAALWQLCCRIGRATTVACQVVDSRARYHRLQRATGAGRGANAGTAQRAGDRGRTYPANRHRVCIRTRSCVRRFPILIAIGAAFGYGTRAHTLSRILLGCGAAQCTVRRQSARAREHRSATPGARSTATGAPAACPFSNPLLGTR